MTYLYRGKTSLTLTLKTPVCITIQWWCLLTSTTISPPIFALMYQTLLATAVIQSSTKRLVKTFWFQLRTKTLMQMMLSTTCIANFLALKKNGTNGWIKFMFCPLESYIMSWITEDVGLAFSHQCTVHKMKAYTNLGSGYDLCWLTVHDWCRALHYSIRAIIVWLTKWWLQV